MKKQFVVCIGNVIWGWFVRGRFVPNEGPKKGDIDEVEGVFEEGGNKGYFLKGYNAMHPVRNERASYHVLKFRPVDESFGAEEVEKLEKEFNQTPVEV